MKYLLFAVLLKNIILTFNAYSSQRNGNFDNRNAGEKDSDPRLEHMATQEPCTSRI
jgi:hypothetical protein